LAKLKVGKSNEWVLNMEWIRQVILSNQKLSSLLRKERMVKVDYKITESYQNMLGKLKTCIYVKT
jgi:hypothetical protein